MLAMIYGMYLSTAGTKAQSQRQDVIANNMANVDTSGFRRQFITARQRLDHLSELGRTESNSNDMASQIGGGVHLFKTYDDFKTQGTLKPSSSATHLAIQGEGFFRVQKGGQTFLTRDGAFTLGPQGELRTSDGQGEVLSTKSKPIRVDPNIPFAVSANNDVTQEGRSLGQIAVVMPQSNSSVERVGGGMFRYDGRHANAPGQVQQFVLEGSNVDPIDEMVDLIEAARGFEINVNMIQLQNQSLQALIQSVPGVT